MHLENLEELICRYHKNLDFINNSTNDEVFKWNAVQHFQNVWFCPASIQSPFADKFEEATSKCSVLLDTKSQYPRSGIVKLAKKIPEQIENLFQDVLFANDNGDLNIRQRNMENFVKEINALRQHYFPKDARSDQTMNTASIYLSLYAPDENYIYRYSLADTFATRIEYGIDIGSGQQFSLSAYYGMCDMIKESLKNHVDLLNDHNNKYRDENSYPDGELHIMVFDLLYCTHAYLLDEGLSNMPKRDSIFQHTMDLEAKSKELERQTKLKDLLHQKEAFCEMASVFDIGNFIGTEVKHKTFGLGIVTARTGKIFSIEFSTGSKSFEMNDTFCKFFSIPNDPSFSEKLITYLEAMNKITAIDKELNSMSNH